MQGPDTKTRAKIKGNMSKQNEYGFHKQKQAKQPQCYGACLRQLMRPVGMDVRTTNESTARPLNNFAPASRHQIKSWLIISIFLVKN